MSKTNKIKMLIFGSIFIIAFIMNTILSIPYYSMENVTFQNLDEQYISASYEPNKNGKGVIIASDLSHDKSELSTMIYELKKLGYGIYTFDFPSQGSTGGNIPFHSNSKSYLAEQFYSALIAYSQLDNLTIEDIHVVGYGSGARAILETASMGLIRPASTVLVGVDINLTEKFQYNVLNFSKDKDVEWVNSINKFTPGSHVRLIYSAFDNVSTVKDNEKLQELLTLQPKEGVTAPYENDVTTTEYKLPLHYNLMGYKPIVFEIATFISEIDGVLYLPFKLLYARSLLVVLMFISIILSMSVLYSYITPFEKLQAVRKRIRVKIPKDFLKYKLIFYLPTFVVMGVLPILLYSLPMNFPYNDIFRFTVFVSYGLVNLVIYKFSNFAYDFGQHMWSRTGNSSIKKGFIAGLILLGLVSLISFSGMYQIYALKSKYLWILIFTLFCFITFYVDEKERLIIGGGVKTQMKFIIVNYLGIPLSIILTLAVGLFNTAYMLLLMGFYLAFVLSFEPLLHKLNSSPWLSSLIKAIIFQFLVFGQCTMFLNS